VSGHSFRLWAGNLLPTYRLEAVVKSMMSHPLFPIGTDAFKAEIAYRDFRAGEALELAGGITIRTAPLDHPDGATGYRLEFAGRTLAYLTDNEGRPGHFDQGLLTLARDVDLAIYDCTFTEDEIASKAGWGHSTWRDGLRLADEARVKTFCMFHHAPEHDDAAMDRIAADAAAIRPGTVVATEGAVIEL
jgi:phosphoribosyl 1,2-cyclic phosphodiesterase